MALKNRFGALKLVFALLATLVLGGQHARAIEPAYTSEDTLEQWENHLLESKWTWRHPVTGMPHMVLVLKYFTGNHRTFELTMFHDHDPSPGRHVPMVDYPCRPWVETWTGTYKTEARRAEDKKFDQQDAVKLIRLRAEQHWYPVNSCPYWWSPDGHPAKVGPWMRDRGLIDWTDMISNIDWVEKKQFKEFFAELIFDAPFMADEAPIPADNVRFFLRSDAVKKIGWWQIGTEYVFEPVKKCD
jgi:hypothetical protein